MEDDPHGILDLASDRSAGSLTTTIWLAPDGTPGETEGGAHSVIPYWP
jgi:hypothetical protein